MTQLIGSPTTVILLVVGLYVAVGLVALFVWLERRDRSEVVVAVVFAALVAQLSFYTIDSRVPMGPFRPGPFRLPELLLGAALVARLWTRPESRRLTVAGVAWLAFGVWTTTGAVIGHLNGNAFDIVLFHGKVAAYVGGSYLLVAGVPIGRLVSRRALGSWLFALSGLVTVQSLSAFLGVQLLGPLTPAGTGPDSASFYFAFGIVVILVEAARESARVAVVVAMVPLIVGPLVIGQRASVVHFAVTIAAFGMVMAGPTWRRRMKVRPTQLLLGALGALTLVCLAVLPGLSQGEVVPASISETVEGTFGGAGNSQSADARVSKWDAGLEMFKERPLLGWGLGIKHRSFAPGIDGFGVFREGSTFDNIVFDLLVRSGIPGLLLFGAALSLSIRDGWKVWLRHSDPRVAALGLGLTGVLIGLLAKGVVESVFEKVVLAMAIGLAVGAIASARAEAEEESAREERAVVAASRRALDLAKLVPKGS